MKGALLNAIDERKSWNYFIWLDEINLKQDKYVRYTSPYVKYS